MKTIATAILLSLGVAAGAQAADSSQPLTRAQVQAELAQAKANGQYSFGELDYPATVAPASNVSRAQVQDRSEEHTSELQSLMRISYAVFCLKKKRNDHNNKQIDYE